MESFHSLQSNQMNNIEHLNFQNVCLDTSTLLNQIFMLWTITTAFYTSSEDPKMSRFIFIR